MFFYINKQKKMNGKELAKKILVFFIPMTFCYVLNYLCPISSESGKEVSWRPPAKWFGIIWAILFVLLGLSWSLTDVNNNDIILYSLLTLTLGMWIYVYSCLDVKSAGPVPIFASIILIIIIMCLQENKISIYLLAPLLVWLVYAFSLNVAEII